MDQLTGGRTVRALDSKGDTDGLQSRQIQHALESVADDEFSVVFAIDEHVLQLVEMTSDVGQSVVGDFEAVGHLERRQVATTGYQLTNAGIGDEGLFYRETAESGEKRNMSIILSKLSF